MATLAFQDRYRLIPEPDRTHIKSRLEIEPWFLVGEIPPPYRWRLIKSNSDVLKAALVNCVRLRFDESFKFEVKHGYLGKTEKAGEWLKDLYNIVLEIYSEVDRNGRFFSVWQCFDEILDELEIYGITDLTLGLYKMRSEGCNSIQLVRLLKSARMKVKSQEYVSTDGEMTFNKVIQAAIQVSERNGIFKRKCMNPFLMSWIKAIEEIPSYSTVVVIKDGKARMRAKNGRRLLELEPCDAEILCSENL